MPLNVNIEKRELLIKIQVLKILWSEVWKGGFQIDTDSRPLGYVLWCCVSNSQDFFTMIQISSGHTVYPHSTLIYEIASALVTCFSANETLNHRSCSWKGQLWKKNIIMQDTTQGIATKAHELSCYCLVFNEWIDLVETCKMEPKTLRISIWISTLSHFFHLPKGAFFS